MSTPDIIRLDSVIIDNCQDCIEIIDWSGPACNFQFELNDSEHSLHNTIWKFDRYVSHEDTLLAPCIGTVEDQIIFESDPVRTLAITHGYLGEMEDLFDYSLFSEVPYDLQLSNNQLILSQGEDLQFIFYAE